MDKEFNKSELQALIRLLKEAEQEFSNHCCNDFFLDNTDENKKMMIEAMGEDDPEIISDINSSKDELVANDACLMNYFINKLTKIAQKDEKITEEKPQVIKDLDEMFGDSNWEFDDLLNDQIETNLPLHKVRTMFPEFPHFSDFAEDQIVDLYFDELSDFPGYMRCDYTVTRKYPGYFEERQDFIRIKIASNDKIKKIYDAIIYLKAHPEISNK